MFMGNAFLQKSITSLGEVKRCLDQFLKKELFCDVPDSKKPRKTHRRYYPSRKDLRNHIARAISAQKYSNDDQESLRQKIEDWRKQSPQSKYFYRPREDPSDKGDKTDSSEEKFFFFVHQEPWQKKDC